VTGFTGGAGYTALPILFMEEYKMRSPKIKPNKGYVQVYTGDGKGKTTAALGLAIRAAGAGFRVFIGQFVKGQDYSELHAFTRFSDLITVRQFGRECFIFDEPGDEDIRVARRGLEEIRRVVRSGTYKLVILDEANIATHYGLFDVCDLIEIIEAKPQDVELIITGRWVNERIIERADLVTEMREIKHYYRQGVMARVGIES
jgi:cob(I)alamin adenosyltransferase